MDVAVLSRQGGREYNEDACGYWTSDGLCCWVLSDGAGGHGGGDVASKLVVSTILRDVSGAPTMSAAAILEALRHANRSIIDHQHDQRRLKDMRATAAVLLIDQATDSALWGHVGDSRIYCFRGGTRLMQTRDHSVVQSVVDAGMVDPQFLRNHPQRNVLLAALGSEDEFDPALAEAPLAVHDGDVFLMCSDGLWEYVEEAVMESELARAASAQEWLAGLEAEVLRHAKPGHDNYSALAVWLGAAADATRIIGY